MTVEELAVLLAGTDLYLTPYKSPEQIVSGALTFAVAAGCAVVSTPYLYAEDLLGTGAGVLVPFGDSAALAAAVNELLGSPTKLEGARAEARRVGARLGWSSVGRAAAQVLARAAHQAAPESRHRAPVVRVPEARPDLLTLLDDGRDRSESVRAEASAPRGDFPRMATTCR